tara:strand:- start:2278 stop:2652 length:375 start_codon:yes stop_codon:yes gene_type:complete
MKIIANLTITALAILALNSTTYANRMHTLDDIHEAEKNARQASFIQRQLALRDPKLLKKMHNEQNLGQESTGYFSGHGRKLGGDKYVNRLLGIEHKEGKYLTKAAKKQAKAAKKHRYSPFAPAA